MRPSSPTAIYEANEPGHGRIGDDGCIEWDPRGEEVPWWVSGAAIMGAGMMAYLLVLLAILLAQPANPQPAPGTPGGPPVPTTYGPPPGSN